MLGVDVQRGRGFTTEDDREGAPPVALLSDRYWRRTFGAAPDVTGRTVVINHQRVAIVGVGAAGFRGISLDQAPDVFVPFHVIGEVGSPLTNYFVRANVEMSPTAGVVLIARSSSSPAQIDARLAALPLLNPRRVARLAASPVDVEALPRRTRAGVTQFARILGVTVALLLLGGCLTVGTLLLVRTEARSGEFAMCLALGASRARLARGVAIEGAVLTSAGAALAIPVGLAIFQALRAFQLPGGVTIDALELSLDSSVVVGALTASLAAMALIGGVAAWLGFRADMADAIRSRGASTRLVRRRSRVVLVAGQVAIALMLVAGAGVFTRTLLGALALNADVAPSRLVTGTLLLRQYQYDPPRAADFFTRLKTRLEGDPSITSLSFFEDAGGMSGTLAIDGVPRAFPTQVEFTSIDERYFSTIGLALAAGRDFAASDGPNAPLVGIVSESFARLLGEGGSALGKRITMPFRRQGRPPAQVQIVGVVPDVVTRVAVVEPLVLYQPLAQRAPSTSGQWVARAAADPAANMRSRQPSARSTARSSRRRN